MIPQPPQITPEPLWRRAYLQAGTLVMAVVTQAGLIIRDLKTAVCCRHRMVNRRGLPTRQHLDADLQHSRAHLRAPWVTSSQRMTGSGWPILTPRSPAPCLQTSHPS